MSTGLIDVIKRASLDAVDSVQMSDLRYGTVVSEKPLKVEVTNLFTIPESILVVPQHLTDYEIEITTAGYGWESDDKGGGVAEASYETHKHQINQSKKTIKVHGALKVGDKVALMRKQGGQSYFILDRIPGDA